MIEYKFRGFSNLSGILTEEITIDTIVNLLDRKKSKEVKELLKSPEEWAKYAFLNELPYHLIAYRHGDPIAHIENSYDGFGIEFIAPVAGSLFRHLSMEYNRFDLEKELKEDIYEYLPNNEFFLRQINTFIDDEDQKGGNTIFFKDPDIMEVTEIVFTKKDKAYTKVVKETKVNFSHNFVKAPEHYLDYDRFLDYQNILKPEYLDLLPGDEDS